MKKNTLSKKYESYFEWISSMLSKKEIKPFGNKETIFMNGGGQVDITKNNKSTEMYLKYFNNEKGDDIQAKLILDKENKMLIPFQINEKGTSNLTFRKSSRYFDETKINEDLVKQFDKYFFKYKPSKNNAKKSIEHFKKILSYTKSEKERKKIQRFIRENKKSL